MIKYSLEFLNFSEVLDCREWVLTGPNMFVPSFCQYPSCTIRYCTGVHCSDITQGTYIIEQYTFIMYKGFQKNQGTWKRTVFGMTKKSFQVSRFLYYPKICNVFQKKIKKIQVTWPQVCIHVFLFFKVSCFWDFLCLH